MNAEPVVGAAAIAGVIAAAFSFGRIMGWIPMSDDQFNALMTFVGLLLPIVLGLWARNRVTPVSDPKAHNLQGNLVDLVPEDGSRLAQRKH